MSTASEISDILKDQRLVIGLMKNTKGTRMFNVDYSSDGRLSDLPLLLARGCKYYCNERKMNSLKSNTQTIRPRYVRGQG